jgi:hypothetical protein
MVVGAAAAATILGKEKNEIDCFLESVSDFAQVFQPLEVTYKFYAKLGTKFHNQGSML